MAEQKGSISCATVHTEDRGWVSRVTSTADIDKAHGEIKRGETIPRLSIETSGHAGATRQLQC